MLQEYGYEKPIDKQISGTDIKRFISFKDNKNNTWDNQLFFKFYDRFTPYGKELMERIYIRYKNKKLKIKNDKIYSYEDVK
jgi:hypothetical protein